MTLLGWIVIGILSLFALFLLYNLITEVIVNKDLGIFKSKRHVYHKVSQKVVFRKAYQLVLVMMLTVTLGFSGVFDEVTILSSDKILTNAHIVGSEAKLRSLLESDGYDYNDWGMVDGPVAEADGLDDTSRDYIDTNEQVLGVSEGDIIKTDGNYIYYASRYYQKINVVYVKDDYTVEVLDTIDLGDLYTENMYLTDDYLVVVGYTYDYFPVVCYDFAIDFVYTQPTSTVALIDRTTNEVVYSVETDTYFMDHRIVDDVMYMVSTKYVYQNQETDLRPSFVETKDGEIVEDVVDYDEIYYYDDVISSQLTVITTINLTEQTYESQAFLGSAYMIYMTESTLYTIANTYHYTDETGQYESQALIMKFNVLENSAGVEYRGSVKVNGYIEDSYWVDEYDGYLRVVTTTWQALNRLYVLEEDLEKDVLNVVSLIDEGIGHEGEMVKSVRFNGTLGQIVTFEQTDPLYTVDLSDPSHPVLQQNPIEEEGYSTYLHVWTKDYYLVGFGFDANSEGRVTGLKLSAYDTRLTTPVDAYTFASDGDDWFYSYSEAIYNPHALMIDATKGIVGFPMSSYHYTPEQYYHESAFVIFFIDFESDDVISEPVFITHDETDYYMSVDRGIYIDELTDGVITNRYIYTFSYEQVLVYHIESETVIQKETLNEPRF